MVLGRFHEPSRAPTPSKKHRPEAGCNEKKDQIIEEEDNRGQQGKGSEGGSSTYGTVGVARVC